MKRLKHIRIPLLWQYFLSYLMVMLVLVFGISIFTYEAFYELHREIIYQDYQGDLELIRNTTESELLLLYSSANQLTSTANVSSFNFTESPEKFLQLKRQLSLFSSTNEFFSSVYLTFDEDDYVYSSSTLTQVETFVNKAITFEGLNPEELTAQLRSTDWIKVFPAQNRFLWQENPKKVIPVFVPIGYMNGTRIGSIMYFIDVSTYDGIISGIATGNRNVYLIDESQLLYSWENCDVPQEQVLTAAAGMKEGESIIPFEYGKDEYFLCMLEGSSLNISYLMLVSKDDFSIAFSGTMQLFLVIIAAVLAFSLVVVLYIAQKRVRPIQALHRMISDGAPIRNDELVEIRNSVQRLIDSNADLHSKMENVELLRKNEFAFKFLAGGIVNDSDWLSMAEEIHLNVDRNHYSVAICAKPASSDYELTPIRLERLFDENVNGVGCIPGLDNRVVLILFADKEQDIYDWLESKLEGMRVLCSGLTLAASAIHSDYHEGRVAYLEAENAFERRFVCGNSGLIRFIADQVESVTRPVNERHLVESLRHAFKAGDIEQVSHALNDITRAMRNVNTSLFGFRCMYNDILTIITQEARGSVPLEQDAYNLFKLSSCLSLDDLDVMLHNVCDKLMDERDNPKNCEAPPQIAAAMELIRKHYCEPEFTVSAIARELEMSESKLSVEFKAAYHITPLECVTHYRMQQACRLLKSTSMPVKDIAVESGYYEISGFNRRFKASTGMTPQQYRLHNREKSEEHYNSDGNID